MRKMRTEEEIREEIFEKIKELYDLMKRRS
jgi:hypothetical protein